MLLINKILMSEENMINARGIDIFCKYRLSSSASYIKEGNAFPRHQVNIF